MTRLTPQRAAHDLQAVVARIRCPPGGAGIEVDGGRRVAYSIEGTGVPARPWADALGSLVGEEEVEIGPAEGWPGDALNLLQHPRAQVGAGGGARADRLPWPGEPDTRQMDVYAHQVQGRREGDQHNGCNRPAEYQAHRKRGGRPLDPRRDASAVRARIAALPAGTLRAAAAGSTRMPWWQRSRLPRPAVEAGGPGRLRVPGAWILPAERIVSPAGDRCPVPRPICGKHAQQKEQKTNHAVDLLSILDERD